MTTPESRWLTRDEAAIYLRCTDRTIDRLAEAGKLTKHLVAGNARMVRFSQTELDALLEPVTSDGEASLVPDRPETN
jgi:excisionase family DNA binding protein